MPFHDIVRFPHYWPSCVRGIHPTGHIWNPFVNIGIPSHSFYVVNLNKMFNKRSTCHWFETSCNSRDIIIVWCAIVCKYKIHSDSDYHMCRWHYHFWIFNMSLSWTAGDILKVYVYCSNGNVTFGLDIASMLGFILHAGNCIPKVGTNETLDALRRFKQLSTTALLSN